MASTYEKRTPDTDQLGHCTHCGTVADHVHFERVDPAPKNLIAVREAEKAEERNAARRAKAAEERAEVQEGGDYPAEAEDEIEIEVELDPVLVEAFQQADNAEAADPPAVEPEPQDQTRRVPKPRARAKAEEK